MTDDGGRTVVCRCSAPSRRLRGKAATKPLSSERGFTLIELVITITIIVLLMGFFLNRALFYMEQAEKTAMEQVAGAIQSALTLQYGQILTRGKPSDVTALAQDNPMNWLQKKPRNYSGEFYDLTPQAVESGNWVFDLKSQRRQKMDTVSRCCKPRSLAPALIAKRASWIDRHRVRTGRALFVVLMKYHCLRKWDV
jgi:prepilin-type N-terminal cleavage/methylation domain-containing protein